MPTLISVTELGYSHSQAIIEGNSYYTYGPHIKNAYYWLCGRVVNVGNEVWDVSNSGAIGGYSYSNSYCLAPVIRLG